MGDGRDGGEAKAISAGCPRGATGMARD